MAVGWLSYAHTPTYKPSGLARSRTTVRSVPARPSAGSDCMKAVTESAVSHTTSASIPSSRIAAVVCVMRASHPGACARATNGGSAHHTSTPAPPPGIPGTLSLLSSDGPNGALQHPPDQSRREEEHPLPGFLGSPADRPRPA